MAGLSQDYITLTQMNCVKECRALIQSPKQRNFLTAAALFGLYCGVLLYRSYTRYLAEMQTKKEEDVVEMTTEELQSEESYIFDPPPVTSKELLLPPIYDPTAHYDDVKLTTPRSEIEPFVSGSRM